MAALSTKERDAIRITIFNRYDVEVAEIEGTVKNAKWKEEVQTDARKRAIATLGIVKELTRIEQIEKEIEKLTAERTALEEKAEKKLPKQKSNYKNSCPTNMSICAAINMYANKFEVGESEEKHPVGKKILALRKKKIEKIKALEKSTTREDAIKNGCFDW